MSHTYIIAELSANHGHSLQTALATVRAAKECGADAIKIQTYTPDTITLDCRKADFVVSGGTLWDGRTLYELYGEAYTPWEWHEAIFAEAKSVGIDCFSTPFDRSAVDFLSSLDNPIYKIASFEITDTPLIEYAARQGRPMIISTGVATLEDIEAALAACRGAGNGDVTLLKCTSAYPAPIEAANLATMVDMRTRFGVRVGLSDHTAGHTVAAAAVALGAAVVEKHFILDRSIGGADAAFSLDKAEFADFVRAIRETQAALGSVYYPDDPSAIEGRQFARSLYVAQNMVCGEVLTAENLRSVRPSYGLPPRYLPDLLGSRVNRALEKGTPFSLSFIE